MRWTSTPSMSRASSSSHSRPQMTLMTFQPAPRKTDSSSWMILPLPRTGPSSRCRLQLTTKVRLSRPSRAAMESEPSVSGSSVSPSPMNAQTRLAPRVLDAAVVEVAVEARLVDGGQRREAHRDGGELPEVGHQAGVRIRAQPFAGHDLLPEVVELRLAESGPRGTPGRRCRARRGPGRRPGRPWPARPCRGRSG